jgi:2-polyprenyl-3-methyl-5-hydroxy-6-metoxy-1,4-benzoquinol methylase
MMLTQRSQETELMDLGANYYSRDEYKECLKILFKINKLMGFFRNTRQLLKKLPVCNSVLDVGCGGGLFVLHLGSYFPEMRLVGVDISADAIEMASDELRGWRQENPETNVSFELKPAAETFSPNSYDVVLSTLVCHHLTDSELVEYLPNALSAARVAVVINDLQRHAIAEFLYGIISPILFRNRLITHDGLISIRRGFTRSEWKLLLQKANIKNYKIQWLFPFRWRVILWKA